MAQRSKLDHGLLLLVIALLSWAVPGAGHFAIEERKRGIIIFITIVTTFLLGIYAGSIGVIDSVGAWHWYIPQILTTPGVAIIARMTATGEYVCYGKPYDIGQIYTTIAGMLNLLCIISAVCMAHSGRGELVGEEENAK